MVRQLRLRLCYSPSGPVLAGAPMSVIDRLQRVYTERRGTPRQWNVQVSVTGEAFTCRLALVRCDRSSSVLARCHSAPVSARQSAEVSDKLLRLCLEHRQ